MEKRNVFAGKIGEKGETFDFLPLSRLLFRMGHPRGAALFCPDRRAAIHIWAPQGELLIQKPHARSHAGGGESKVESPYRGNLRPEALPPNQNRLRPTGKGPHRESKNRGGNRNYCPTFAA